MVWRVCGVAGLLGVGSIGLAQSSFYFEIEHTTLLPGQSTQVQLWAAFPAADHSVAGIWTSLRSSTGSEGFSDMRIVPPLDGPGTTAGTLSATGVDDILAGQLMFPICGIGGCPPSINPIVFWEATYTAPADATPMALDLSTLTSRFDVYPELLNPRSESRLEGLVEASATIHIVPAPAGVFALALGLVCVRRRR
ncbi:MAG: hypothetical protein KIT54_07345 [Phycisphaeraceae bacterium]|nr:hypothetical protein [Phycisphaeraceae bacterium]